MRATDRPLYFDCEVVNTTDLDHKGHAIGVICSAVCSLDTIHPQPGRLGPIIVNVGQTSRSPTPVGPTLETHRLSTASTGLTRYQYICS